VLKNHDVIIPSDEMFLIFLILRFRALTYEDPMILHGRTVLYFFRKEGQKLRMQETRYIWIADD